MKLLKSSPNCLVHQHRKNKYFYLEHFSILLSIYSISIYSSFIFLSCLSIHLLPSFPRSSHQESYWFKLIQFHSWSYRDPVRMALLSLLYFRSIFTIATLFLCYVHVHGQSLDSLQDEVENDQDGRSRPDSKLLLRSTPSQSSSNFHVNVHTHPKTTFSCAGKQPNEYYADVEAKCAVYFICIAGAKGEMVPVSFACPNGTLFNQANKVCAQEEMVFCAISSRYYESVRGKMPFIDCCINHLRYYRGDW